VSFVGRRFSVSLSRSARDAGRLGVSQAAHILSRLGIKAAPFLIAPAFCSTLQNADEQLFYLRIVALLTTLSNGQAAAKKTRSLIGKSTWVIVLFKKQQSQILYAEEMCILDDFIAKCGPALLQPFGLN